MLFTEPIFLFVFLPILLALYAVLRRHPHHPNMLLVVASILFYAKGGGSFTWLMLGSIAFNYGMAILVHRAQTTGDGRRVLGFAVAVNLAVLGFFKYATFLVDNVNLGTAALGGTTLDLPPVVLPIGISFYTFHAISYVVDVYRREATAQKSPVHAALYLLLFPQLIAGPIIRYRDLASQLTARTTTLEDVAWGIRRFAIGLGKKVLVANTVATVVDTIFALPGEQISPSLAWLAVCCYTLQIYFDFSGYSDMAIGLGRLFGFRFPENFRWPYAADSVQDFWRRWHLSLSSWFRDYVYIPLGGSRGSTARTYGNLVAVFFLCGLWHGASWTFVAWGLYHGLFLVCERVGVGAVLSRTWRPVRHLYVLMVVMGGWVLFRSETFSDALVILGALGGRAASATTPFGVGWFLSPPVLMALCAGGIGSLPVGPWVTRLATRLAAHDQPWSVHAVAAGNVTIVVVLLVLSIAQVAAGTYNPFIYFRF